MRLVELTKGCCCLKPSVSQTLVLLLTSGMLQTLPQHRPADALVDARQALVRRVVAAAPVDVRAAPGLHGEFCQFLGLIFGVSGKNSSIVSVPGELPTL